MPFYTLKVKSLPENLHAFHEIVLGCLRESYMRNTLTTDHVSYITVEQSFVRRGDAQRRQGLHIETPGRLMGKKRKRKFHFLLHFICSHLLSLCAGPGEVEIRSVGWGVGENDRKVCTGGIFVGSSVRHSMLLYPKTLVTNPEDGQVVGGHGECEHLRDYFTEEPVYLKADEIWWMTDRTPHEALPVQNDTIRTFFRLVVGDVTVWFSKHNTANPLCPLPNDVIVIDTDKFAPAAASNH